MDETAPLNRPSSTACAFSNIRRASRTNSRSYDRALRPSGRKITQYSLPSVVREPGPISISGLADALALERTSLTRNLRPLEQQGLIRVSPEGYRRARLGEITDEGLALWQRALGLWQTAQQTIDEHLGAERSAELRDLLAEVTAFDDQRAHGD
jgi:DNA-binding MarR family transcriptional regulator